MYGQKNFIAEQGATGVESLLKKATNDKRLRTTGLHKYFLQYFLTKLFLIKLLKNSIHHAPMIELVA